MLSASQVRSYSGYLYQLYPGNEWDLVQGRHDWTWLHRKLLTSRPGPVKVNNHPVTPPSALSHTAIDRMLSHGHYWYTDLTQATCEWETGVVGLEKWTCPELELTWLTAHDHLLNTTEILLIFIHKGFVFIQKESRARYLQLFPEDASGLYFAVYLSAGRWSCYDGPPCFDFIEGIRESSKGGMKVPRLTTRLDLSGTHQSWNRQVVVKLSLHTFLTTLARSVVVVVASFEPATFRSLVQRANDCAIDAILSLWLLYLEPKNVPEILKVVSWS